MIKVMRHHRSHSHGTASIDFYACQSGLRHWNGPYKVFSSLFILVLCLGLDHPWISVFVILTIGTVNLFGNRISFLNYFELLKMPFAFLLLGSAAVAIGISKQMVGQVFFSLGGWNFYVTKEGMLQSMELFLKSMAAVSSLYLLALSTPASELVSVLRSIHMPKVLAELMNMVYRFIFILFEVQREMRIAAASRLGDVDFKTSCCTFGQIGGNLLILALKKANTYYDAMVSRGYEGELLFWEEEKPIEFWQYLLLAGYFAVLVLARFCLLSES